MFTSRKIAFILTLTLFCGGLTLAGDKRFADRTIAKAYDLFIPIACSAGEVKRARIGTGFPVGKDLVMTAKHVDCVDAVGEGAITEISNDGGKTWQRIPDTQRFGHTGLDVQIMIVDGAKYKKVARFRDAVIGERVAGYGIAFGETATYGFVMKSSSTAVAASNAAIGGMSGSALVGRDGKVVGMTILAVPTIVGDGIASSWVSVAIPGPLLEVLVKGFVKSRQTGGLS